MTGRRRVSPALFWTVLGAIATALAVNVPLAYIFVRAAGAGWPRYAEVVFSQQTLALLARTLLLVGGVLCLAVPLSVTLAWLVTRTDLPGRRVWAVVASLPLVFPSYVAAFAWVSIWGPKGFVQKALAPLGIEILPSWAYGYSGAWLVLALFTYPYVYLLVVAGLRKMDPSTEEAARSLGRSPWAVFFSAVLPQLKRPLYAGSLLMALYTLSDFGAVSIVRYKTFTLSIYNAYRGLFDRSVAASLATVLVVITVALIVLESWLSSRLPPSQVRPSRPPERLALGRWRWPATLAVVLLAMVNLMAPLAVVVHWAVKAWRLGNPIGVAGEAALHSLGVAVLAAVAAVALSLPVSIWAMRHGGWLARLTLGMTYSGYALPGLVIALSLVFFATRLVPPLYQTVLLLVVAYVVRFLPEAVSATRASLGALAPIFEEAAKSLGRGSWSVLRTITLPLIRPGLLAGAGLVFLTTMKELPATLILRPTGFETLATRVWTATSEGVYSQAALPALALVGTSAIPVYFLIVRPVLSEHSR
ncbi:MAG: iron ABC transporter permease [Acidobacteria bacterium]|nr:iron ABC transporter permease [Acidobacteriota bacterium]